MKRTACTLSIIALCGSLPNAFAASPSWCSALGGKAIDPVGSLSDAVKQDDPRNVLQTLVARTCNPDDDDRRHMQELDAARRYWMKRYELAESDWSDVAEYALLDQGTRMASELRLNEDEDHGGHSRRSAWSTFGPFDQWAIVVRDLGNGSDDLMHDHAYFMDALGPRLSEIGRLAYVSTCVRDANNGPVQWAMCQGDIAQLDFGKALAEVRAEKAYGGAEKMQIRIALDELEPLVASHAARIKKLIASDPGYARMFEIADATRKEWATRSASDGGLLALAAAMDDARATNSRRALAGCQEKTWSAWQSAVAGIPANAFEAVRAEELHEKAMGAIMNSPRAYLASVALVTCLTLNKKSDAMDDFLIRDLAAAMQRWPGFRGPRTATHSAILGAGIELDDRGAQIAYPDVNRKLIPLLQGGHGAGGKGVVSQLKPAQGKVVVELKQQLVKVTQCAQYKETNHVTQIRPDGSLVYQSLCVRKETITVNRADPPQTVNERYTIGIKPGMFVSIVEDVIVGGWSKPGASTPAFLFGVALK